MTQWAATVPATSRHTNLLLPLLPSGPGGVYSVSLREDQHDHHHNSQPYWVLAQGRILSLNDYNNTTHDGAISALNKNVGISNLQTPVPPTVMPSILIVGWPTPTGTLWPSLPQVPTPLSS